MKFQTTVTFGDICNFRSLCSLCWCWFMLLESFMSCGGATCDNDSDCLEGTTCHYDYSLGAGRCCIPATITRGHRPKWCDRNYGLAKEIECDGNKDLFQDKERPSAPMFDCEPQPTCNAGEVTSIEGNIYRARVCICNENENFVHKPNKGSCVCRDGTELSEGKCIAHTTETLEQVATTAATTASDEVRNVTKQEVSLRTVGVGVGVSLAVAVILLLLCLWFRWYVHCPRFDCCWTDHLKRCLEHDRLNNGHQDEAAEHERLGA